ncbi:hypothetical protein VH567_06440 [Sphingomonas sp. 4RDLI-65]|uniref:hypothetical protein n=1 Tax=Sphingomonas sp. 4RDLI-65 TaxID=3111641 RepID=UPI003C24080F
MTGWTAQLKNRIPPRLRMFVSRLSLLVVTWLAVTGAIEVIRGDARPSPLVLAGLVIGCALAAIFKPVPPEYRHPAE